jgi:hypothetical protein
VPGLTVATRCATYEYEECYRPTAVDFSIFYHGAWNWYHSIIEYPTRMHSFFNSRGETVLLLLLVTSHNLLWEFVVVLTNEEQITFPEDKKVKKNKKKMTVMIVKSKRNERKFGNCARSINWLKNILQIGLIFIDLFTFDEIPFSPKNENNPRPPPISSLWCYSRSDVYRERFLVWIESVKSIRFIDLIYNFNQHFSAH